MIMKSISYETVYVCRLQVTYIINRTPPPPLWYFQINDDMITADYYQQLLMAHPSKDGSSLMPMTLNLENVPSQICPQKCLVPKLTKLI